MTLQPSSVFQSFDTTPYSLAAIHHNTLHNNPEDHNTLQFIVFKAYKELSTQSTHRHVSHNLLQPDHISYTYEIQNSCHIC